VLQIFRWLQRQKWYRPDNGFYSKLISIMGKAKQLRLAVWLFGEVKRSGHRPDTSLYNALITAYLRSREQGRGFEKAVQLLQEMKGKPKYNILLNFFIPILYVLLCKAPLH
jgi:pentatricopeptide repeat protein